jgi:hypothetical protein
MPGGARGGLGVAGEVGELFDLRRQHGGFDDNLVALGGGAPAAGKDAGAVAGVRATDVAPEHFTLPDQLRGEEGGAAAFAGRAPQDQELPQFSTSVCASPRPYNALTCPMD